MLNMNTKRTIMEELICEDRSERLAQGVFIAGVSVLVLMALPFALKQTAAIIRGFKEVVRAINE